MLQKACDPAADPPMHDNPPTPDSPRRPHHGPRRAVRPGRGHIDCRTVLAANARDRRAHHRRRRPEESVQRRDLGAERAGRGERLEPGRGHGEGDRKSQREMEDREHGFEASGHGGEEGRHGAPPPGSKRPAPGK